MIIAMKLFLLSFIAFCLVNFCQMNSIFNEFHFLFSRKQREDLLYFHRDGVLITLVVDCVGCVESSVGLKPKKHLQYTKEYNLLSKPFNIQFFRQNF